MRLGKADLIRILIKQMSPCEDDINVTDLYLSGHVFVMLELGGYSEQSAVKISMWVLLFLDGKQNTQVYQSVSPLLVAKNYSRLVQGTY